MAARVIVGVSGGVDSSVAALLMRDAGEDVAGVFMRNWVEEVPGECRAEADRRDAVAVCGKLRIPLYFRDFSAEYQERVFRHFLTEYAAGRTPNPDVLCNREVKFRHFLDSAQALGAEAIATGHYARVSCDAGQWKLLRAADTAKDQTYFLHQLGQEQLSKTRFPLGDLHKPEVRRMAAAAQLPTAAKKDSTGICFIGERDFRSFLSRYLPMQPGEIRTPDGTLLGEHAGVFFHTIGQRGGLRLGGVRGFPEAPWYVVAKDVQRNLLTVAQGAHSPWLESRRLRSEAMHWIAGAPPAGEFECSAQVRHRQQPQACRVRVYDENIIVEFAKSQRAVTPGQSVVLYDGDECLGGAVIAATDAPLEPAFFP